jgi:hypothetical protein
MLPVVVTLAGWLMFIRGILLLFLSPSAAIGLFTGLHYEQLFYLYITISLVFGAYLTYGGFGSTPRLDRPSAGAWQERSRKQQR